jgi:hypothetical protein
MVDSRPSAVSAPYGTLADKYRDGASLSACDGDVVAFQQAH